MATVHASNSFSRENNGDKFQGKIWISDVLKMKCREEIIAIYLFLLTISRQFIHF